MTTEIDVATVIFWTLTTTVITITYVRHILAVRARKGDHLLRLTNEPAQTRRLNATHASHASHATLRAILRCTMLAFFVLQFENSRLVAGVNFENKNVPSALQELITAGLLMPCISCFAQHLAGFSWSEICVSLFNRLNLIFVYKPMCQNDHWTWTGNFVYPLTGLLSVLLNCYGFYWILKTRSLAGSTEHAVGYPNAGETDTDCGKATFLGTWRATFWRCVTIVTPKSRHFDTSWIIFFAGLCLVLWSSDIFRLALLLCHGAFMPERRSTLLRMHFPHAVATGLLFAAGLVACWVIFNTTSSKELDHPVSRTAMLQCGLSLIIAALIACYTALDLGVYPTDRAQVLLSLLPTLVIGIVGMFAAASVVCANPWSDTKRDQIVRRSISVYPLTLVVATLIVPIFWRPGNAPAVGLFHVVTADQYGHSELLNAEHRHFADSETSYCAARLLVLAPIVAVQLVLRTRTRAILSLAAFSAFHIWVVADDHTDVPDGTVMVALFGHLLLAVLSVVFPLFQRGRGVTGVDEVLRCATKDV